ncbi:morphinone reductase [Aeromonas diversa CDC 2478-85]|uniref:Morphinone reductase n=1 Tax=Aeromonas diversa CDC 2478-85 TaxID=1268237 RepID=N9V5A8_9GAMM|nr:alkene reductase [Aeromonas diversa]ENY70517.1 morphinone reductase [Aeromonas diversa CDC 2478-85]
MQPDPLFFPLRLGPLALANRIVMPPMTRSRAAQPGDVATELMATYYAQRAGAGLIVSEGTQISPLGKGYAWTPGIHSPEQVAGWRTVTDAVHANGGAIFAQLWHVGRVTHPDNIGGAQPVSASALRAEGVRVFVDKEGAPGFVETVTPRALSVQEIADVVQEFRQAARNAMAAGFDGIELHGANGYLINQFLDSESNTRTDRYGGALDNRLRFLREVVEAVGAEIGMERVGVRLAPLTTLNGTVDADPEQTYTAAARLLGELGVVYLHIAEADWDDAPMMRGDFKQALRAAYPGALIYAGKYDAARARAAIAEGWADLVGFGRPFVANPDLPERIRRDQPWAQHDPATLFGGDAKGLTDYPKADGSAA